MDEDKLKLYQKLIAEELMKRKISDTKTEDLEQLSIEIRKKLVKSPPLLIKRAADPISRTFYISGYNIRSNAGTVKREMEKYGKGGIDYYGDYEYDDFIFVYKDDKDADRCEQNFDRLITHLTSRIYKK